MEIEITVAYTVFNWHFKLSFKVLQRFKKKKKEKAAAATKCLPIPAVLEALKQ